VAFEGTPIDDDGVAEFFAYLTANGADASKVTLADFGGLRGVMALQDIAPGEAIITVPYELSLDLGSESSDPTAPAVAFLDHYLRAGSPARPYLAQIPAADSADCTTTDFFSEDELALLQCPQVVRATAGRAARLDERAASLARAYASRTTPGRGTPPPTLGVLRWATWVVVSRVLTVQGREANAPRKCLIPLIDMVNHHPTQGAAQVLSGRAAPGSFMKVLAGPGGVAAGKQVFIQYGGGAIGSARFLQDYGFLEPGDSGVGCRSRACADADLGFVAHVMSDHDRLSLATTSLAHDRALLRLDGRGDSDGSDSSSDGSDSSGGGDDSSGGVALTPRGRLAVQFRVFLKEAFAALQTPEANARKHVSMGAIFGE